MVEKEHLIDLVGISKEFDGVQVLKNINLYIRKKEFITLLGPSGCGKTTTLRIIGGFETPSEGQVLFGGQDISALPPYNRRVNTVFQKYALFPHLNVYDNIAFGLKLKKLPKKQIAEKVGQMLELVNLKGYESASTWRFRAVRSSAGRLRAVWSTSRRFSCWTSRWARLT